MIHRRGYRSPVAVMGIGIPGAGKTTVLTALAAKTGWTHLSSDVIREVLTGDPANQDANAAVFTILDHRIQRLLAARSSVIVDATHATSDRAEIIGRWRRYGAESVIGVWCDPPIAVAAARNSSRDRVVPDHVLVDMFEALRTSPPSWVEGFTDLIHIQNGRDIE